MGKKGSEEGSQAPVNKESGEVILSIIIFIILIFLIFLIVQIIFIIVIRGRTLYGEKQKEDEKCEEDTQET